ncbi:MAG: hypothetical protein OEW39_01125 [Deltaproteobacteria bacterium]|nr:hypothetical protein [Deltaproteobacteria bacterium]
MLNHYTRRLLGGSVGALLTALVSACAPSGDTVTVAYSMTTGCTQADVTYTDTAMAEITQTVSNGWSQTFSMAKSTASPTKIKLSATSVPKSCSTTPSALGVTINLDGTPAATASSEGATATTTISASTSVQF